MSSELKRSKCLEKVNHIEYRSLPSLLSSGRYISSLRYLQRVTTNTDDKMRYEYVINKCLTKHIVLLQETLLSSGKSQKETTITPKTYKIIQKLSKSDYAAKEGKYSLVDVEGLKKIQTIKRAVVLSSPLVLPCKVKSENKEYKFNTQIIMTPNNVLGYTRGYFEYDDSKPNINHNTLITKAGKGIKNNEFAKKAKQESSTGRF